MLIPVKATEMRTRADRHSRWAVILETAGECALALEHFARAMQFHAAADELELTEQKDRAA